MAEFEKKKHAQDEFNNGNKYVANDGVQPATINNLVENSLYTEAFAESLASTPDTTKVAQVGTPTVELVDNPSAGITGAKKFKFSNLKGEQGHGYFRVTTTLETTATSVASSYVQWGGATVALASDSIVDNNGNVFAVTTKTAATSPTIPISYRTSIRGTAGADGDSVFVRYSASSNGANMTATPSANTRYIGFYRGQSASNTASDYTWSQYVGKEISEVAIDEFSFIITYDDGTTSTAPLNTENCLVTYAVSSDEATAMTAYLVPNNADLNDYRGENYWGKTFYAGGSNTVQNIPVAGAGFSLEVLRSGSASTTQRITSMAAGLNNQPTIFTRSVVDTTTTGGEGTWTAWTEVAEANGTYPEMEVGEARKLSMRANVSGAGQLGWYKVGTVTVEGLKAIQNANASYSLFMLVNGANPPGTNNSAARSGIIEIDTAVGSDGQLQLENGYTAIKVLCGNIDVNDFAVAIDSAGTTLTVYMDARENGVGTRTAFSIISEIYGALSGSAFEFGWEFYGAAAPADAVYAQVRNNASGDEDGNNIKATYAKQNGTYSNMTVGSAHEADIAEQANTATTALAANVASQIAEAGRYTLLWSSETPWNGNSLNVPNVEKYTQLLVECEFPSEEVVFEIGKYILLNRVGTVFTAWDPSLINSVVTGRNAGFDIMLETIWEKSLNSAHKYNLNNGQVTSSTWDSIIAIYGVEATKLPQAMVVEV